jgi:hypothetical protein
MKTHPHETTVCATFKDALMAKQALQALEPLHLDSRDVSLITSEAAYEREELVEVIAGDKLHEESVHAGKVGGLTGAIIAAVTAIAGMITGGTGLLAAGPIVAIITGAGGVLGGLLGAGFTENAAQKVDNAIRQGHVVILVHAENKEIAKNAEAALKGQGAEEVHHHH